MRKKGTKISQETRDKVIRLSDSHAATMISGKFRISRSAVYKIRNEYNHHKELSATALAIAKNLDKYRKVDAAHIGSPNTVGPAVYGEDCVASTLTDLDEVDREKARDLLSHVKAILPELQGLNIQDEPKDWIDIEDDAITNSFVNRLEIIAHKGKYKGKCSHCPK